MDLSTIQMHLENFVNTWEGWHKVVEGLSDLAGFIANDALPALSSK
ncbi:hypothetical protein [uncultured Corynebacterium sp.]|nr:hypothetical protein [uncultured Corynebacterium sp.]